MHNFLEPTPFAGRLVIIGFGAVAQGVLPLLFRHLTLRPEQVRIITADACGIEEATAYRVAHRILPLSCGNYREIMAPLVGPGDFVLNLAVNVSSVARDLDGAALDVIATEIGLADAIATAAELLQGKVRGRVVVNVNK